MVLLYYTVRKSPPAFMITSTVQDGGEVQILVVSGFAWAFSIFCVFAAHLYYNTLITFCQTWELSVSLQDIVFLLLCSVCSFSVHWNYCFSQCLGSLSSVTCCDYYSICGCVCKYHNNNLNIAGLCMMQVNFKLWNCKVQKCLHDYRIMTEVKVQLFTVPHSAVNHHNHVKRRRPPPQQPLPCG